MSSIYGIAKAAEIGMGLASLPDWMEFNMNNLIEILPELKGPQLTISLSFKYELRKDIKINVFKEFLLNEGKELNTKY